MTSVEITQTADRSVPGKGWTAYRVSKKNLPMIFDTLWDAVKKLQNHDYEYLTEALKYINKEEGSRAKRSLNIESDYAEVLRTSTLPIIWIIKDEK